MFVYSLWGMKGPTLSSLWLLCSPLPEPRSVANELSRLSIWNLLCFRFGCLQWKLKGWRFQAHSVTDRDTSTWRWTSPIRLCSTWLTLPFSSTRIGKKSVCFVCHLKKKSCMFLWKLSVYWRATTLCYIAIVWELKIHIDVVFFNCAGSAASCLH